MIKAIKAALDWIMNLPSPATVWALWCDRDRSPDEIERRGG